MKIFKNQNKFSIIEISVVLLIILLLMTISVKFYKTVQRSILKKNQLIEFENIKMAIKSVKSGTRITMKPSNNKVTIYDLIYTHGLLSQQRILVEKDKAKAGENILSYFGTPIEVYVTKKKRGSKQEVIDKGYAKIPKKDYLTGEFEIYFGNDHEVDGGESKDTYGLKGDGTIEDAHQYFYKFVYKEYDDGPEHEFKFQ